LLKEAEERLREINFPTGQPFTAKEFTSRIQRYEDAVADLAIGVVLLARWAEPDHIPLLERIMRFVAEFDKPQTGVVIWIRLSWYPVLVLMYAAGISALAANRPSSLRAALLTPVSTPRPLLEKSESPIELPTILELSEIIETFKSLP